MKKVLSFMLATLLAPLLFLSLTCTVCLAEEGRPVLTIGDVNDRSNRRIDGDDQLGLWQYLED